MNHKNLRWFALTVALGSLLIAQSMHAQATRTTNPATMEFGNTGWFPSFWGPYSSPYVPQPRMSNSERVHSLISGGKLRLSIEDALALALENNLDISVARYNLGFAQTDLLRAKSGGATRGVPGAFSSSALFAGAIGGGISGISSSSTTSASGVTGSGGATNVGVIGCCDPVAGAQFGWDRRTSPLNYTVVSGAPVVTTQTSNGVAYFGQGFLTGTSYAVAVSGYRQSTTSLNTLFNPVVPTSLTVGFDQQLLNGFGYRANAKFIRIAQNDLKISNSIFRQQVITTVAQVLNLYWDYLSYKENVRVAGQALAFSEKLLSDNKRQVEIGTLAPIEVVRAESEVASDQQSLIVAQTSLQQQAELIKTALARKVDSELISAQIDAVDKLPQPTPDDIPPLDQALKQALQNRPEVEQADLNVRYESIVVKANRNALLPTLDLFATYAPTGLSGLSSVLGPCPSGYTASGNQCLATGLEAIPRPMLVSNQGISQSLSQLFHGNYPDYSFGFTLQFPIRNRSAQADVARALLEQRQLEEQLQKQKNQVEQDVRSAEIGVIQAKAQIQAAVKAVLLAQKTLDAEQKKFQLGESTVFLVIQAQRDLATAEGNEVKARSTYAKALTQFQQVTATILAEHHVELNDALQGKVARSPNIPGTHDEPAIQTPPASPQG
ncbi:MAG: TolC family protein [Terriglobia bacterium]|jgi:outer membrane protein TolC